MYGVWNSVKKAFQFGICETTKRKAAKSLFNKIGYDSYKWRFSIRKIPNNKKESRGKFIMNKPNDFDNVQAYGEFTPLKLGGHICKIMQVKETQSKTGKDMLEISIDIAEGDQKDYFANQYRSDTRQNKKWGCIIYQLVKDAQGNTNKGFKTFVTSVEHSNPGFKVVWGDNFAACFKGKLIGGVFGREEYLNANNEKKFATKCVYFRSVEAIRAGVEVPEDKLLPESVVSPSNASNDIGDGFMNIPDGLDEELPFFN